MQTTPDLNQMVVGAGTDDEGQPICSFLALLLRKELEQRLASAGHRFEWSGMKQDLPALKQIERRAIAVKSFKL